MPLSAAVPTVQDQQNCVPSFPGGLEMKATCDFTDVAPLLPCPCVVSQWCPHPGSSPKSIH